MEPSRVGFQARLNTLAAPHGIPALKMAEEEIKELWTKVKCGPPPKRFKPDSRPPVETSNKFEVLPEDVQMEQATPVVPPSSKKVKVPPIIVTSKFDSESLKNFHVIVKKTAKNPYTVRYLQGQVKIQPTTMEDWVLLTRSFKNVSYFSYSLKSQLTKKIVLKASSFFTEEEVKTMLAESSKIPEEKIGVIKMKSPKKQVTRSFLISIPKEEDIGKLKAISTMDHVRVQWQQYSRKSRATQCHGCQQFGHGSSNCHQQVYCVKCAGEHHTSQCHLTVRGSSEVKCANCGGAHTANYSGCEKYIRYVQSLKNKTQPKHHHRQNTIPQTTDFPQTLRHSTNTQSNHNNTPENTQPKRSYASTLKNTPSQPSTSNKPTKHTTSNTSSTDDITTLFTELQELNAICNLSKLLSMVRELKSRITPGMSTMSQFQVILELSRKYD